MAETPPFEPSRLLATSIRDLGLTIAGTPLEPVLAQFQQELQRAGITRLRPHFYLSTEWGVPFGTISIAIPFYLARPDLTAVHAERIGHLEGVGTAELLRYLRHEMGHVVNYAYQLFEQEEWIKCFGSITQPYADAYRPEPFSRKFVRHLPGWYAQKHPDEDWAETFAVWMTPRSDWRTEYGYWPEARAKLDYCDRLMALLRDRDPPVTATELDEDVSELASSLEDYYRAAATIDGDPLPPGLDGALQAIFQDIDEPDPTSSVDSRLPAADLLLKLEQELSANVYRWSGHFPESTRHLVQHLAQRARELQQVYPADQEPAFIIAVTTLVTTLAMNYVMRGSYIP
ncbi:MAG: putative zinc-binding metallopeptidase [Pirellulaceae bacterium]